jgi:hypothetical protein
MLYYSIKKSKNEKHLISYTYRYPNPPPLISQETPWFSEDYANPAHYYYPNMGQLIDLNNEPVPEVLYHTDLTNPQLFFHNNKISFVSMEMDTLDPDTVYRLDMSFVGGGGGPETGPASYGQKEARINYYLPHTEGGISGVAAYESLKYTEPFESIDVELSSNASGPKMRFVVAPGGDPDDIQLQFEGQDQILELTSGELEMYLGAWKMELRQAYAYQIHENGNPYLMPWLPIWVHDGQGKLSFYTGSYNTEQTLVLEMAGPGVPLPSMGSSAVPPDWSTYYGGAGLEQKAGLTVDASGDLYTVSNVKGSNAFPPFNGAWIAYNTVYNCLITHFTSNDERDYSTYIGGAGNDYATAITESDLGSVYIGGYTESTNYFQDQGIYSFFQSDQGGIDGFVSKLNKSNGIVTWSTYFGGEGTDVIEKIRYNSSTNQLHFVGRSNSTQGGNCTGSASGFPFCNLAGAGYYQDYNQGDYDAFVAEVDDSPDINGLVWSTMIGGDQRDKGFSVVSTDSDLYLVGETSSDQVASSFGSPVLPNAQGHFPLADPGAGAYFQSQLGSSTTVVSHDGFICRFNSARELVWNTFFGGVQADVLTDVSIKEGGVYAVGRTSSNTGSSCVVNANGNVPLCQSNPGAYQQHFNPNSEPLYFSDVLITSFTNNNALDWSTCYGANGEEGAFDDIRCVSNAQGELFVLSHSYPITFGTPYNMSTQDFSGQYYQSDNTHVTEGGYSSDNILLAFNADHERTWATYFGGGCNGCTNHSGDEVSLGFALAGNSWLYLSGETWGTQTPYNCPHPAAYCDPALDGTNDGYVSKLNIANVLSALDEVLGGRNAEFIKAFPNPAVDEVFLELPVPSGQKVQVEVYTSTGVLMETTALRPQGTDRLMLDAERWNTGWYILRIRTEQKVYGATVYKL